MAQSVYTKNDTGNGRIYQAGYETCLGQEYSDDQNCEESPNDPDGEYTICDGRDVAADRYFADNSDDDIPARYRHVRSEISRTEKNKVLSDTSKFHPLNVASTTQHASRHTSASLYQNGYRNPPRYSLNEIGDYVDCNYPTLQKSPFYYSTAQDIGSGPPLTFAMKPPFRTECFLRRGYNPDAVRLGNLPPTYKRSTIGHNGLSNITFNNLRDTFKEQYDIDQRKQVPSRTSVPNRFQDQRSVATPRMAASEKRVPQRRTIISGPPPVNTVLRNENHSGISEKTMSSPRMATKHYQDGQNKNDQAKELKSRNNMLDNNANGQMKLYGSYANSYTYDELLQCKVQASPEKTPPDESDIEVKYKNKEFRENGLIKEAVYSVKDASYPESGIEPSSVCESSGSNGKDDGTSDEKICLPENPNICKIKNSARSGRSKGSSINKKHFNDLANLERSKCNVLSVIDDGLHRIEQSRNETICTPKSGKSTLVKSAHTYTCEDHGNEPNDKALACGVDIVRSDFINNMFKEYRGYHLENMKQEIKRIQYLDSLPEKWVKQKFSSAL